MLRHGLNFYIKDHPTIEVAAEEICSWASRIFDHLSEAEMEHMQHDMVHAILNGASRKVRMAKADAERARIKRLWKELHPPNHAGYYYCHLGGEWVHEDMAELEHIIPSSVERINTEIPGWDEKLRMACHVHNSLKGSSRKPSATLEFAPPDEGA